MPDNIEEWILTPAEQQTLEKYLKIQEQVCLRVGSSFKEESQMERHPLFRESHRKQMDHYERQLLEIRTRLDEVQTGKVYVGYKRKEKS